MTQGRDGIQLAPNRARGLMGVARRLSVVAAMFAMAAFVATGRHQLRSILEEGGQSPQGPTSARHRHACTNYGAAFGGSVTTFNAGATVTTPALLLGQRHQHPVGCRHRTGWRIGELARRLTSRLPYRSIFSILPVSVDFQPLACVGAGNPVGCCTGVGTSDCEAGTGFAEIFLQGANKNSAGKHTRHPQRDARQRLRRMHRPRRTLCLLHRTSRRYLRHSILRASIPHRPSHSKIPSTASIPARISSRSRTPCQSTSFRPWISWTAPTAAPPAMLSEAAPARALEHLWHVAPGLRPVPAPE